MKKLMYLFVAAAMFAFMACGGGETKTEAAVEEVVIEEVAVEEVVEDTATATEANEETEETEETEEAEATE